MQTVDCDVQNRLFHLIVQSIGYAEPNVSVCVPDSIRAMPNKLCGVRLRSHDAPAHSENGE